MSFIISVYVNEGIVLASDRRTTYSDYVMNNGVPTKRFGVHTTDNTDKTFLCPNGAGISTCGDASLQNKPITGFIQEMIRANITKCTNTSDIPNLIIEYFYGLGLPSVPDTHFFVAGYDLVESKKTPRLYRVTLCNKHVEPVDTNCQGAVWDGEITTFGRLMHDVAQRQPNGSYVDFPHEDILFQYFTLQDAVDFARYAVETTIQTMRFKNVVETVGGNVDILVIRPDSSEWLQKAELH